MAQSHSRGLLYTAPPDAEPNREPNPRTDEAHANPEADETRANDPSDAEQSKPTAPADD